MTAWLTGYLAGLGWLLFLTVLGVVLLHLALMAVITAGAWAVWNYAVCATFADAPHIRFWPAFFMIWLVSIIGRLIFSNNHK